MPSAVRQHVAALRAVKPAMPAEPAVPAGALPLLSRPVA